MELQGDKNDEVSGNALDRQFHVISCNFMFESVAVKGTGQEQEDPPRCFFFKPGLIGPRWTGQQFGASNMKNAIMLYSHACFSPH